MLQCARPIEGGRKAEKRRQAGRERKITRKEAQAREEKIVQMQNGVLDVRDSKAKKKELMSK